MEKTRVKVFHAGTAMRDGQLVTDGGRVLAVTAVSDTLPKAVAAAYQAADMIEFEGKHLAPRHRGQSARLSRGKSLKHPCRPAAVEIAGLDDAIAALRAGELVVFPTETFYGIAADPFSPSALEKLFAIKGRDPQKPIALIAADAQMAFSIASEISYRRANSCEGILAGTADDRAARARRFSARN